MFVGENLIEIKKRPDWYDYFMGIANIVATRSTCDRAHVGAVIVREKRILSTGYNGSPAGAPHCDEIGHQMENDHCVRTIHAEMNAIVQSAKNGVNIAQSNMYVTHFPCYICFKQLANAGIRSVTYAQAYRRDPKVIELATQLGITLHKVEYVLESQPKKLVPKREKKSFLRRLLLL